MWIEREVRGSVTVFRPAGPVVVDRHNAAELERAVLGERGASPRIVLDAAGVEFFESEGVDSLLRIEADIARRGGKLALAGLNGAVAEFFRINGLDCLFHAFADVAGAIRRVTRRPGAPESWHTLPGPSVTAATGTRRSRERPRRDSPPPSSPSAPSA